MHKKKLLLVHFILMLCVLLNGCGRSFERIQDDEVKGSVAEKEESDEGRRTEEPGKERDASHDTIIDVKKIALKSEAAVNKILGKPDSTSDLKWSYYNTDQLVDNCFINVYRDGLIRVYFIEGIAGIIKVAPEEKIPISDDMSSYLSLIGLEAAQPVASNEYGFYWADIDGIYEVQMIHDDGNISYIEVIAEEKYAHF